MTRRLHSVAKELFLELLELPPEERRRRMERDLGEKMGDDELRREVLSLLSFHQEVVAPPHETVPLGTPSGDPFEPGRIFGGRYRILSELGRGGMGRVLRARDLVLDEDVALKILPHRAERRIHLDLLVREVRLARRISHPNVCRVFDFGEAEGEVFLSMEYVDGEDLGSLLRRIGRLPREKLLDLAHQLCAGLAAAHDAGILHRDLKPANVMIDGRGRVKITDFGIASLRAEVRDTGDAGKRTPVAGTPAYMAPEAWDGEPSERSDVYALGLLIFEMATGTRAFDGKTPVDYARRHHEEPPPTPSLRQERIDPQVEEVILRCLEKDPARRPASARAVAAALPGGDALQRALDAGQTPSPDAVADAAANAAGAEVGERPALPMAHFAALVVLVAALFALGDRAFPRRGPFLDRPPEARAEQASTILRELGHPPPVDGDRAYGFRQGLYLDDFDAVLFWYREARGWLLPEGFEPLAVETRVTYYDPAPLFAGDVQMLLTDEGRLGTLKVITGSMDLYPAAPPDETNPDEPREAPWEKLWEAVGWGEEASPTPVDSGVLPPMYVDERRAWTLGDERLEAAVHDGRVVLADLRKVGEEEVLDDYEPTAVDLLMPWVAAAAELEWMGLLLLSAILAAYHLPTGRGDLRGARRLALAVFVLRFGRWLLASDYTLSFFFLDHLRVGLARSLADAAFTWLAYVALEPVVRRVWPHTLVAWTRLLRWRAPGTGGRAARPLADPEIARGLLVGVVAGAAWAVATCVDRLAARGLGFEGTEFLTTLQLDAASAGRRLLANVSSSVVDGILDGVLALFLLVILRLALRRRSLAIVTWALVQAGFATAEGLHPAISWLTLGVVVGVLGAWVLVRVGLLAYVTALAVRFLLESTPFTLRLSSWAAESGVWVALLVLALGAVCLAVLHRRRASLLPHANGPAHAST